MNRLQKKCVLATAGVHLLLLLILVVGPAFFAPRPGTDDLHVLDVIPANLIDAPFNSGAANAAPPVVTPPPQPPAPAPVITPPAPPEKTEKAEPAREPVKTDLTPVARPNASQTSKIQISTQLVSRTAPKGSPNDAARARAIRNAIRSLKNGLSSGTGIDMPGNGSGEAYANYRDVVYSIYNQAWTLPANIANDDENVTVSVLIASDGTVLNTRIVTPSGDAPVDASVQRALERVTFIAPFPKGATEKERTYTINFNPKAKRMLE